MFERGCHVVDYSNRLEGESRAPGPKFVLFPSDSMYRR